MKQEYKHTFANPLGLPRWFSGKESACNAENPGSIPGVGRSSREGNGDLLQYSCLGNPMSEEPGQLQCLASQRVGHDLATEHTHMHISPLRDTDRALALLNVYIWSVSLVKRRNVMLRTKKEHFQFRGLGVQRTCWEGCQMCCVERDRTPIWREDTALTPWPLDQSLG